jgi:ankyrin repeat protein
VNESGQTPLHFAAQTLFSQIFDELIAKGASVDLQDKSGATPLFLCVQNIGKMECGRTERAL